jgi:hypothetical protein
MKKRKLTGPDFSDVTQAVAEQMFRAGRLEKLFLLPPEFGGADIPENFVYVPIGLAAAKQDIDMNLVAPMVQQGTVKEYSATPEYSGKSFVPVAVHVRASNPGSFQAVVNIWGDALTRE